MKRLFMPGQKCCPTCFCDNCHWDGLASINLELVITGIANGTCSSCTTLNNTYILPLPWFGSPCKFNQDGYVIGSCFGNSMYLDGFVGVSDPGFSTVKAVAMQFSVSSAIGGWAVGWANTTAPSDALIDALRRLCNGETILLPLRSVSGTACNYSSATMTVSM